MSHLWLWKWWAGLVAGAVIIWALGEWIGLDGLLPFFIVGVIWGMLWSLLLWPWIELRTEEKNNGRR